MDDIEDEACTYVDVVAILCFIAQLSDQIYCHIWLYIGHYAVFSYV